MSMTLEDCAYPRPSRAGPDIPSNALDQFNIHGKVCVITGASRGIGYAVAEGLAEVGATVAMVYTSDNPQIEHISSTLGERCGVKVTSYRCDVANTVQVQNLVSDIVSDLGRIDVFVANAGISIPKPILEQSLDEYHVQMGVNVHGVFYCAKYVGAVFKAQGHGNMIITGSICARVVTVPVDSGTYNTTKAAITQLGKSLAREWREFARVNIVAPGYIDTDMSSCPMSISEAQRMAVLGRQGTVKELKAIYLYLASDASSFVTGSEFTVDGGYTLP